MGDRPFYALGVEYYSRVFYEDSSISEGNKKAVAGFVRACESEGIGVFRIRKYYSNFRTLLRLVSSFVLGTTDLEALRGLVSAVHGSKYADHTKADLKILLKKFYKVSVGGGEYRFMSKLYGCSFIFFLPASPHVSSRSPQLPARYHSAAATQCTQKG